MDLSVILPVHNLEKFITPMLVSLNLQELEDLETELIFVCDHCTDKTEEIISQFNFKPAYKARTITSCDCCACGLARNIGLDLAQGEYILFLDGDDWLIDTHAFVKIVYNMRVHNFSIIRFNYEAPGFHAKGHPSMVWQYGYRRDLIGDTIFTNIQPDEDLIFNNIIAKKVGGFSKIPFLYEEYLYHYNYMREDSNTHQMRYQGKILP